MNQSNFAWALHTSIDHHDYFADCSPNPNQLCLILYFESLLMCFLLSSQVSCSSYIFPLPFPLFHLCFFVSPVSVHLSQCLTLVSHRWFPALLLMCDPHVFWLIGFECWFIYPCLFWLPFVYQTFCCIKDLELWI